MGLGVADFPEHFVRIRDDRRAFVGPHRGQGLDGVRDPVGVGDDHLFRFPAAQILEFLQHFLGGAQKQGCLIVRVLEALAGHDDPAVNLVLRVQEMHIAGGNHRLVELLAQRHDPPVVVPQILLGLGRRLVVPQHEHVVADGLDFQIIIKIHDPGNVFLGAVPHQRPEQLSGLAGRPQDQSLPVLHKQGFGDLGLPLEIFQMRGGDQPVQIQPPRLVFRQNDGMVGMQLADGIVGKFADPVQIVQRVDVHLFQHFHKFYKNLRRTARIVHGPVMIFQRNIQRLRHRVQLEPVQVGQQDPGNGHRVHDGKIPFHAKKA